MKLERRRRLILGIVLAALVVSSSTVYLFVLSPAVRARTEGGLPAVLSVTDSKAQPSRYITEYQVAGVNSQPNAIASDSDGDIWFTLAADYAIGELNPANGTTHEFQVPHQNGSLVSWGIAVDDAKGLVWFTDQLANSVWSFDIASHEFTRHQLPDPFSSPYQLAVDGSGDVWFTEFEGGRIGEITDQGSLREYTVPTGTSTQTTTTLVGPAGIAIGKDGTVWFTEVYADSVGSFDEGTFHRYPLVGASSPTGIALDPSSGDVWVTLHGGSDVAEFDPATNSTRVISTSVPTGVQSTLPYFVAVDAHGDVWFDEHYGNAIARFTPSNQTLVEYEIPTRVASLGNISGALTIGLDPAGHPWFTEFYTGKVGMVDQATGVDLEVSTNPPTNGSGAVELSPGGNTTILVHVEGGSPSTLAHSQGTGPTVQVSFSSSPSSGNSTYTSTMTLAAATAPPSAAGTGVKGAGEEGYTEVTISAVTPDLVCSQVIEVEG
jgi:streptogramin lyase